jgi:hypothetical protein
MLSIPENLRAGRMIGAMFFFVFGGAWLALWGYSEFGHPALVLGGVGASTLALFGLAYGSYRSAFQASSAGVDSPEKKKADQVFYFVNAGQWVVIFLVITALNKLGLAQWIFPALIFIVGLHFLPLAYLFKNRMNYLTGGALLLVAVIYPFAAGGGPRSSIGCLCTGVILWCSAIWAIVANQLSVPAPRTHFPTA